MKRFLALFSAVLLLLSTAACSVKAPEVIPSATQAESSSAQSTTEPVTRVRQEPVNSKEFWQSLYPDAEINKFTIKYMRYDEVESKVDYYFESSAHLCDWVNSEFNTDGWFVYNEDTIVSPDGMYKITNPKVVSPNCSYKATKVNREIDNHFRTGYVHTLDSCSGFKLYGLILKGNLHDNYSEESLYSLHGLNDSFWLDEHICIYLDAMYKDSTDDTVEIYCVPHKDEAVLKSIADPSQLKTESVFRCININLENNLSCEGTVNSDSYPEGQYDLLFVYDNEIVYYVTINVSQQDEVVY